MTSNKIIATAHWVSMFGRGDLDPLYSTTEWVSIFGMVEVDPL